MKLLNYPHFLTKIFLFIIIGFTFFVFWNVNNVFAINNCSDGWQIDIGTTNAKEINCHGICKKVVNNCSKSIFVPTNIPDEWLQFRTNKPDCVSLPNCTPAPTLSVSLSASQSSGTAPLNGVGLTANASGTATGNIRYRFDCTNDGSYESDDTVSSDPYTPYTKTNLCNYSSAGTYTAKVRADREGLTKYGYVTITVSAGCECNMGDICCSDGCNFDANGTSCGNCGSCSSTGSCQGQGVCAPGSTTSCTNTCNDTYCDASDHCQTGSSHSASATKTCQSNCAWETCPASPSCTNECSNDSDCVPAISCDWEVWGGPEVGGCDLSGYPPPCFRQADEGNVSYTVNCKWGRGADINPGGPCSTWWAWECVCN